jgi:hypothetical protein
MSQLSRRMFLSATGASLVAPPVARAEARPVLLELFTSQGCSSCPPADAILGKLVGRTDVYAISLNVDYWDYLGWRDMLAKPEHSRRQFDYGKARGDMQVYTPQVVANGRRHAVGNSAAAVNALIAESHADALDVRIELQQTKKNLLVKLPAQAFSGEATLWLMAIAPSVTQAIGHGENADTTVTYHNVVRSMVPATMWSGQAFIGEWMRDAVMPADCTGCIAVLQRDKTGPVIGLARV